MQFAVSKELNVTDDESLIDIWDLEYQSIDFTLFRIEELPAKPVVGGFHYDSDLFVMAPIREHPVHDFMQMLGDMFPHADSVGVDVGWQMLIR